LNKLRRRFGQGGKCCLILAMACLEPCKSLLQGSKAASSAHSSVWAAKRGQVTKLCSTSGAAGDVLGRLPAGAQQLPYGVAARQARSMRAVPKHASRRASPAKRWEQSHPQVHVCPHQINASATSATAALRAPILH
jgi:hypothetical protein